MAALVKSDFKAIKIIHWTDRIAHSLAPNNEAGLPVRVATTVYDLMADKPHD